MQYFHNLVTDQQHTHCQHSDLHKCTNLFHLIFTFVLYSVSTVRPRLVLHYIATSITLVFFNNSTTITTFTTNSITELYSTWITTVTIATTTTTTTTSSTTTNNKRKELREEEQLRPVNESIKVITTHYHNNKNTRNKRVFHKCLRNTPIIVVSSLTH